MNKFNQSTPSRRLTSKTQVRLSILAIIVCAVFFAFIATPVVPEWVPAAAFFKNFNPHLGLDLQGGTHLVYETDLTDIDPSEKGAALEGSRDVIERRVNTLGVAEPVVQTSRQAGKSRIIVELAGINDVSQAIKLIGETPLLEFKETKEKTATSSTSGTELSDLEKKNREQEKKAQETIARLKKGEDFAALAKELSADEANKNNGGDLGWVAQGVFVPAFETAIFDEMKAGELRATPLKTQIGYHVIKKLGERKNDTGETEVHAAHILFATQSLDQNEQQFDWANTELSGRNLKRSQVTFDPNSNEPQVNLLFDSEGSRLFEDITGRNVGKPVGIFLDGAAISAPTVNTVITGGQAVITGNFTLTEAKLLAQRLNAGALPVPIKLINQQTVGATLGQDSLQKSLFAGLVGFLMVAIFMIAYYRLPGLLSVIALVLYVVIAEGVFELIPITLTLAGVAGFILSIGMAVDANVLIFERIREELRRGQTFAVAVEEGFSRAWLSIRDSNSSSLITCAILYWFGSSIIRGFALTLALGIIISLFSAITVTRTFMRLAIRSKALQRYWLFGVKKEHA